MRVLVTGATGFVGKALSASLALHSEFDVIGATRSISSPNALGKLVPIGEISAETDWGPALKDVDIIVHLAARAHVLSDGSADPMGEFRRVNVEGTVALAKQAIAAGVKRFIFISSIGVLGARSSRIPFDEASVSAPHADYAISKLEAEQRLWQLLEGTSVELTIIRPPLVYGAHAPGNFRRLLRLVASSAPLPLGRIENQRSLIALENLVDFIFRCITHPAAANQVFVIADCATVSTTEIVRLLSLGMGRRCLTIWVPRFLARFFALLIGKSGLYTQLYESLVVDTRKAQELLGWVPPISTKDALVKAGQEFKSLNHR
ncbi:NAD-dependent epimerase/dehydratase family protein [Pseudomonas aeruginosa]|uniref:NAD-dependent epimerase/dehydratase family protein n=1 Tax=Pseudomonas aeruginosa TaxID=287 RepID=UPI000F54788B|nr:NAD-dependent epimerase/dehydratase family protein [Pseudomonas aeruginosa]RQB75644.1 hypothetical protein IPC436_05305 [Pseudomonas aeruginosa]